MDSEVTIRDVYVIFQRYQTYFANFYYEDYEPENFCLNNKSKVPINYIDNKVIYGIMNSVYLYQDHKLMLKYFKLSNMLDKMYDEIVSQFRSIQIILLSIYFENFSDDISGEYIMKMKIALNITKKKEPAIYMKFQTIKDDLKYLCSAGDSL